MAATDSSASPADICSRPGSTGAKLTQHRFWVSMELLRSAGLGRSELSLQIAAEVPPASNQPLAILPPLQVITYQCSLNLVSHGKKRVCQALRVKCRFRDSSTDMRPCNERGVAKEDRSTKRNPRRFQVVDRLQN